MRFNSGMTWWIANFIFMIGLSALSSCGGENNEEIKAAENLKNSRWELNADPEVGPENECKSPKDLELIKASSNGDVDLVKALLAEGACVNAKDAQGKTALLAALVDKPQYASWGRYVWVITELLQKTPHLEISFKGGSALLWATARNVPSIVEALMEEGANLNVQVEPMTDGIFAGMKGYTPLMIAVRMEEVELVRLLAEGGAVVKTALGNGTTATSIAQKIQNEKVKNEILSILESHMATYLRDVLPIFQKRCGACHNESSDLPNYLKFGKAYSDRYFINARVVVGFSDAERNMPPKENVTEMTQEERTILKEWIRGGGTLGVADPKQTVVEPVDVRFSKDIRPIFENKCVSCHSSFSDFQVARKLVDFLQRTIPGDSFPNEPSEDERKLIMRWIKMGARE